MAIKQHFDVTISKNILALFYKSNKIKFRCTKKAWRQSTLENAALELKRAEFAVKLSQFMRDGRQIIFLYESSINNWTSKERVWAASGSRHVCRVNKRRYSVTLFGTVGRGCK